MSTVGFEHVEPLSDGSKLVTIFLICSSFGVFAYVFTSLASLIIDGELRAYFKNKVVQKKINRLKNHVVICGFGRNGRQAIRELEKHGKKFVIVERDDRAIERIKEANANYLYVRGNAVHEESLPLANIENAAALISTFPNDADNLFIILTAKEKNPDITIITRAANEYSEKKLKRAGATNVIMPDKIGGLRMAKLVAEPDVVEFFENILDHSADTVNLKEVSCENMSDRLSGCTIGDIAVRNKTGANIIGLKKEDGEYVLNPHKDTVLCQAYKIFVLGTPDQVKVLKIVLND